MTDINFYSGGRSRKIVAETIDFGSDAWVRIKILDGDRDVGTINIFGATHVETVTEEVKEAA